MCHRDMKWVYAVGKLVLTDLTTDIQFVKNAVSAKYNKMNYACMRSPVI